MTNLEFLKLPDYDVITGSNLYGLATSESDLDSRAIILPPTEYLCGMGIQKFEQYESPTEDRVVYSLDKFLKHVLQGNISMLEMLFAPNPKMSSIGEIIRSHRDLFVTQRYYRSVKGFSNQEERRMRATNLTISSGDETKDEVLQKLCSMFHLKSYERDDIIDIIENSTQLQLRKVTKTTRNLGDKRRLLFDKFGFDTKSASHVIRLLEEGIELLSTGQLVFPRPNATMLLNVKKGLTPVAEVDIMIAKLQGELDEAFANTKLPALPNIKKINDIYTDIVIQKVIADHGTKYRNPLSLPKFGIDINGNAPQCGTNGCSQ